MAKTVKDSGDFRGIDPDKMKTRVGRMYASTLEDILVSDQEWKEDYGTLKFIPVNLADPDMRKELHQKTVSLSQDTLLAKVAALQKQVESFIMSVSGGLVPAELPRINVFNERDMARLYANATDEMLSFLSEKKPTLSDDGASLKFASKAEALKFDQLRQTVDGWADNWKRVHDENIATARNTILRSAKS